MKTFPDLNFVEKDFYNLYELLENSFSKTFKWHENFVLQLGVELLKEVRQLKCDYSSQTIADEIIPIHIVILKNGTLKLKMHLESFQKHEFPSDLNRHEQLRYMPPEIHDDISIKGERVVLYAIGVILYEVCSGKKIISAITPEEIIYKIKNEDFDEGALISRGYSLTVIEFIFSLLEKNFEKRLNSIESALNFVEENLSKKQFIPETLLWDEIQRLKNAKNQPDSLHSEVQNHRPRKKRRLTPYLRVKFSLISLGVISFCISVFLFTKQPTDLKLYFFDGNTSLELRQKGPLTSVGAELNASACGAVVKDLKLTPLLYMSGASEVVKSTDENQLAFGNFHQYSVHGAKNIEQMLNYFKSACSKNENLENSISVFQNYFQILLAASPKSASDLLVINEKLQKTLSFAQDQVEKFDSNQAEGERLEKLESDIEQSQFFETHRRLGFDTLYLNESSSFPQSTADCQSLLDLYWIKKIFTAGQSEQFFRQFDVLLIPANHEITLSKNHGSGLQINKVLKTEKEKMASAVCVYRREEGVLQEISYREIYP